MANSISVLGGGVRGLFLSFLLARAGHQVNLVELKEHLGGILRSFEWNGLYCDFGCHLFDNTDLAQTSLFLEMGGGIENFHNIELKYASKTNELLSRDIAIVDFSAEYNVNAQIWLEELNKAHQNEGNITGQSMKHALIERYGYHIATKLKPLVGKVYASDWENIGREAMELGLFSRVKVADDETSIKLKQHPYFDKVLAASSLGNPTRFYPNMDHSIGRNFYPSKKGMSGFIDNLVQNLKSMGVQFYLGASIDKIIDTGKSVKLSLNSGHSVHSKAIISTLPTQINEKLLIKENNVPSDISVPMVLIYLRFPVTAIRDFTYLHNFNPSQHIFRVSAPGIYGKQLDKQGLSYVCIECPTQLKSDFYKCAPKENIDMIIDEIKELEFIEKNAKLSDFKVIKVSKSYSVPAPGLSQIDAKFYNQIKSDFPNFYQFNSFSFSKSHILRDAITFVKNFNA